VTRRERTQPGDRFTGPLVPVPEPPGQPTKRRPKSRKPKQPLVAHTQRKAKLSDYLLAWAMLAVVGASVSYAIAGGRGACGIVTSSVRAIQAVSLSVLS
jgi:hypothetical protein